MLYEMLAGRRPFQSENRLALLHEIIHGTIAPLHTVVLTLPEALSDVVMKALERDPKLRFQSMWELSSALKFAVAGSAPAVSVDTTSPPIVTGRPSRRRGMTAVTGLAKLHDAAILNGPPGDGDHVSPCLSR